MNKREFTVDGKAYSESELDAYWSGIEIERSRIIKLLEEWRNGLLSLYDLPNVIISIRSINGLIELINGETE